MLMLLLFSMLMLMREKGNDKNYNDVIEQPIEAGLPKVTTSKRSYALHMQFQCNAMKCNTKQ